MACQFGLPYVILHAPRPFDTTTPNYNWQIWETKAFSLYTNSNGRVDQARNMRLMSVLSMDQNRFCTFME